MAVEAKHEVLLRSLEKFYDDVDVFARFKAVLDGESRMSLRVLDWLVTNYAKKRNTVYHINEHGGEMAFNMFLEYKSQLKAYSKRYFDPFCRRGRITHRGVETTCGQLNFFRWAMQFGVLDFAKAHHDEIEQDMLLSIQHRYTHGTRGVKSKLGASPKETATAEDTGSAETAQTAQTSETADFSAAAKRKELSRAAIKSCTTTMVKVKVKFS